MFIISTWYMQFFIFTIILNSALSTINPKHRIKVKEVAELRSGPQSGNVFHRKLIQKDPLVKDIIIENRGYFQNTSLRNFKGKVMAYITQHQYDGYIVSKIWAKKFDIISPHALYIYRIGSNSYTFNNMELFDKRWIQDIKRLGKTKIKTLDVYQYFTLAKCNHDDFTKLFSYNSERRALNKLIIQTCRNNNLDGIVFEIWHILAKKIFDSHLYNLIINLADDLKAEGFNIILSIPAWHNLTDDLFTAQNFENLYSHIEYFSLNTVDYSSSDNPGPIAPLPWVRKAVENIVPSTVANYKLKRKKILMGINLYGYDYQSNGGQNINGPQYINLIKLKKNSLKFDNNNIEHFFGVSKADGRHLIFYPTLYTINERIKLAEELGVGLTIIELGKGLNYFYDLF